jgi:hypothetical protein
MENNTRISIVSSSGSSTNSGDFAHDFSGQELLLLRQLQANPVILESWKRSLPDRSAVDDSNLLWVRLTCLIIVVVNL